MTNKNKILPVLLILTAAILFTSCGAGAIERLSTEDVDYLMSSYLILRGDEALPESRATWPAYSIELQFPASGSTVPLTKQNYPEKGQRTVVTIDDTPTLDVYFVENITTYPNKEEILDKTTETYFVKNITSLEDDLMDFNGNDPICLSDGTVSPNSREAFETLFKNDTIRYEEIDFSTNGIDTYAAFDINGSLYFPTGTSWAPETNADGNFSSKVSYIQEELTELENWGGKKIIIGTRYYTEHGSDPTKPTKTSLSYERVYAVDTIPENLESELSLIVNGLYSGDDLGNILAETVIRYEIQPNGKKTVKTQTQIFDNTDGSNLVTFTANFEEDENGVVTSSGAPVAVY